MQTGTVAGIVVAVMVAAFGVLVSVIWMRGRRRHARREKDTKVRAIASRREQTAEEGFVGMDEQRSHWRLGSLLVTPLVWPPTHAERTLQSTGIHSEVVPDNDLDSTEDTDSFSSGPHRHSRERQRSKRNPSDTLLLLPPALDGGGENDQAAAETDASASNPSPGAVGRFQYALSSSKGRVLYSNPSTLRSSQIAPMSASDPIPSFPSHPQPDEAPHSPESYTPANANLPATNDRDSPTGTILLPQLLKERSKASRAFPSRSATAETAFSSVTDAPSVYSQASAARDDSLHGNRELTRNAPEMQSVPSVPRIFSSLAAVSRPTESSTLLSPISTVAGNLNEVNRASPLPPKFGPRGKPLDRMRPLLENQNSTSLPNFLKLLPPLPSSSDLQIDPYPPVGTSDPSSDLLNPSHGSLARRRSESKSSLSVALSHGSPVHLRSTTSSSSSSDIPILNLETGSLDTIFDILNGGPLLSASVFHKSLSVGSSLSGRTEASSKGYPSISAVSSNLTGGSEKGSNVMPDRSYKMWFESSRGLNALQSPKLHLSTPSSDSNYDTAGRSEVVPSVINRNTRDLQPVVRSTPIDSASGRAYLHSSDVKPIPVPPAEFSTPSNNSAQRSFAKIDLTL